jgi:hypothetical protein
MIVVCELPTPNIQTKPAIEIKRTPARRGAADRNPAVVLSPLAI